MKTLQVSWLETEKVISVYKINKFFFTQSQELKLYCDFGALENWAGTRRYDQLSPRKWALCLSFLKEKTLLLERMSFLSEFFGDTGFGTWQWRFCPQEKENINMVLLISPLVQSSQLHNSLPPSERFSCLRGCGVVTFQSGIRLHLNFKKEKAKE